MLNLQVPATEGDVFRADVSERLREASLVGTDTGALLAALAALAPVTCLDLLASCDDTVAATIAPPILSTIVSSALAGAKNDRMERDRSAPLVLRRYAARLGISAAIDLANAITVYESEDERAALDELLRRFPNDGALLRVALRVAQSHGDSILVDALLTRLGVADPSPATVTFAHRARASTLTESDTARPRIAFVSSYTIDPLVPYVDLECRIHGIVPQTYVAPFNSWTRDVIDPTSGLRRFRPDLTFLSVALDDLIPDLAACVAADALEAATQTTLERVIAVVDGYVEWAAGRPLIVHAMHTAFAGPLGVLDGSREPSRGEWLARLNALLAAALRSKPACYLLDVGDVVARAGGSLGDNPKLRQIAAMRLPPTSLESIAQAYVRYIVPACGRTKKCVVVDLDNTLWGGVVGEDGTAGIRLGTTSPGAEFVEFQKFLRTLTERGILLAINSKNNANDALDAIRNHEAMVLRETDFSAVRINWQSKSENMLEIARELNIGVDSLVFVDDNPDERDRMRQLLPDVLTVEMPKDPTQYRATLERLPELQSLAITAEDRQRVAQYEAARLRSSAKVGTGDVEAYLQSLDVCVRIDRASAAVLPRIAQLFAKTNQFNLTTRRHSLADLERFVVNPEMRLFALESKDRFGDHGLVAVALVRALGTYWEIDSFLMSCRVIGYGIETALLARVAAEARAAGATQLAGDIVETPKNAPARDLYARHGFDPDVAIGTAQRWTRSLVDELTSPRWITRTA